MATSLTAIKQLTERAQRQETLMKRQKADDKVTMDKVVGFSSAFVTSVLAGYVDGMYDVSGGDEISGDGTHVFGVPIIPVVAGVIAVGGMAVGGKVGSAMAYAGLGAACGFGYSSAANKGRNSAANKA